jgi:hypothetical protein
MQLEPRVRLRSESAASAGHILFFLPKAILWWKLLPISTHTFTLTQFTLVSACSCVEWLEGCLLWIANASSDACNALSYAEVHTLCCI